MSYPGCKTGPGEDHRPEIGLKLEILQWVNVYQDETKEKGLF